MEKLKNIDRKDIEDIIALTPMQEGMLFHYLKEPQSDLYFEQLSLEITGEIKLEFFEKAWNFVIDTNEMLRTLFRWEKVEHPVQIILKEHKLHPGYFYLTGNNPIDREKRLKELKAEDREKKFDLREVPFRVTIVRVETGRYEMIISSHHILYDGWSNGIILKEFFDAYETLSNGKALIKPHKTKFKEFVREIKNQDLNKQEKFWRNYLSGFETQTVLKRNRKRIGKERANPGNLCIHLEGDLKNKMENFLKEHKITLASLLYSAWGILLQRYTNSDDIIFGTTVSGRSGRIPGIENMVGLFISTIPLRVQIDSNEQIGELLYKIEKTLQIRQDYENVSLVKIKEYSEIYTKEELFDTILVIENYPLAGRLMSKNNHSSLCAGSYSIFEMTHYDLTVGILVSKDIEIDFQYKKNCFDETVMVNMTNHFTNIIHEFLQNPGKEAHKIDILSEGERKLLLEINNTGTNYPIDKTLPGLFEEQSEIDHNRNAVVFAEEQITYGELNKRTNWLAWILRARGVKNDSIVGLMMDRSINLMIGITGILKAGGAYLPVDPEYPEERIKYMLRDSNVEILLIQSRFSKWVVKDSFKNNLSRTLTTLDVESLFLTAYGAPGKDNINPINNPKDLAYVMYTSGSTGKSKGVMVMQRNVIRLVKNNDYVEFTPGIRILQTGATVFDATTFEIWGSLLNGGCLYLVDKETILDPSRLYKALVANHINTLWLSSPLFNHLIRQNSEIFSMLKYLVVGGDVLSPLYIDMVRRKNKALKVVNGYGPTENTTFSTCYLIEKYFEENIPIGKPIRNSTAYILDNHGCLQPIGVVGELFVGGDGVSRGYLNSPEMTAQKFKRSVIGHSSLVISTPKLFTNDQCPVTNDRSTNVHSPHSPIYLTGDLARWLPDGNIEFLGRIDHQVKIRGFRIEPVETQTLLMNHEQIKEAVVLVMENHGENGLSADTSDKFLCAYIVSDKKILTSGLAEYLAAYLPDYMIPSYFVQIDKIPIDLNGKIDRKALPSPGVRGEKEKYTAPRNDLEKKLVEIWGEVLGIEKQGIGIDHDFFESGGHSLKAMGLVGKIHKEFNIEIPVSEIFKSPTIRGTAAYINKKEETLYFAIEPVEKKEYHAVSSVQKRLYVLWQKEPDNTAYNITGMMTLEGKVNKNKFEESFKKIIRRHESLKTSFEIVEAEPVQAIHQEVAFNMEYYQVEVKVEVEESTKERRVEGWKGRRVEEKGLGDGQPTDGSRQQATALISSFIRPFDLSGAPLLRLILIKSKEDKYILVLDMHHIIADGTSIGILIKEFMDFYNEMDLPVLRIQYKDFSQWQDIQIKTGKIKKQKDYWLKEFQPLGEIPVINLPTDYIRPKIQCFNGSIVKFEIGENQTIFLKQFAFETKTTLYMLLLAVFNVFLAKLSGQEDIVIGSPAAGRSHNDLKGIVGMFVNTLVLRNYPVDRKTFPVFLMEVKENFLKAVENQDYPYEDLVGKAVVQRDLSRNPLFDVMLVLQNMEREELKIPGLKLKPYEYENEISKFDMTFIAEEKAGKILFSVSYSTALFRKETVERFTGYFKNILLILEKKTGIKLSDIEMISDEEKQEILYHFNDTGSVYPGNKTIHEIFEEQVEKSQDNTAIVGGWQFADSGTIALTYDELNRQSNKIAHLLHEEGIQKDIIVGILVKRSIEMVIGILGILKAGGAYLPIDPDYPPDRINYMLKDSNAQVLVGDDTSCASRLSFAPKFFLNLFEGHHLNFPTSQLPSFPASLPTGLAYTMYTSGSTGKPKGVMVEHRNVVNVVNWFANKYRLKTSTHVLQMSDFTFDPSVNQFFGTLLYGAVLYLVPEEFVPDSEKMRKYIDRHQIHIINFVPLILNELMGNSPRLDSIRVVLSGGDRLDESIKDNIIKRGYKLYNQYGPTETAIDALVSKCSPGKVNLGKPISNVQCYIIDKNNHAAALGVAGEICIGGAGVSRGYLNNPEMTSEKFDHDLWDYQDDQDKRAKMPINNDRQSCNHSSMPNPQHPNTLIPHLRHSSYSPIYRTGDLGRWLAEGNVEFLGRIDHQVKIRGFRIELGEIESRLLKHEGIEKAIVAIKDESTGNKYLCAYYVSNREFPVFELREYLGSHLPGYMIPSYFIQVEKILLTPNGKVDWKALPGVEDTKFESKYTEPRDEVEKKLVDIWSEVLRVNKDKISLDSNFFELGGHSLKANLVISKIKSEFNLSLPLAELLKMATIRWLSRYIKEKQEVVENIDFDEINQEMHENFNQKAKLVKFIIDDKNYIVLYANQDIKKISAFLEKKYSPGVMPHYVRPFEDTITGIHKKFDKKAFAKLLGLKLFNEFADNDIKQLQEIYSGKLKNDIEDLHSDIKSKKTARKYYCGGLINWYLDINFRAILPFAIYINNVPDTKRIEHGIVDLLNTQTLLKSFLIKENGKYKFAEVETLENLKLPIIDFSFYSIDLTNANVAGLFFNIIHKTMTRQKPLGNILFSVVIFKLNLKDYILLFMLDHRISDNESGRILQNYFDNYFKPIYDCKDNIELPGDKSYKKFIDEYMINPSIDERACKFKASVNYKQYKNEVINLQKFYTNQKQIILSPTYIFDYFINANDIDNTIPLGYVLYITVNICGIMFDIKNIPIKILNNIRTSGASKYYNTIGDMHDEVPILFCIDDIDSPIKFYYKWLHTNETYSKEKIHFVNMGHTDKEMSDFLLYSPISMNYHGELNPEKEIIVNSISGVPHVPYPLNGYFNGKNKIRIIFYNGIMVEKISKIKFFFKNLNGKFELKLRKGGFHEHEKEPA
jgi:fengycin family lipopeptide synthetase D